MNYTKQITLEEMFFNNPGMNMRNFGSEVIIEGEIYIVTIILENRESIIFNISIVFDKRENKILIEDPAVLYSTEEELVIPETGKEFKDFNKLERSVMRSYLYSVKNAQEMYNWGNRIAVDSVIEAIDNEIRDTFNSSIQECLKYHTQYI